MSLIAVCRVSPHSPHKGACVWQVLLNVSSSIKARPWKTTVRLWFLRNPNSILQGNRVDSVDSMRNSDDIYDSLFGWLLFIWLFFTSVNPTPFTFTGHVYSCPSLSCQNSLALYREGLCSQKSFMCVRQVHASLSVLLFSPGPWLLRSTLHFIY